MKSGKNQYELEYLDEFWRLFPHSYAEHVSDGKWVAYEFLKKISVAIAKAIAAGGGKIIVEVPPQHGKKIADSELVLTTKGWKKHGDLQTGDFVFHPSGNPTMVIAETKKSRCDMIVEFSNKQKIKCHREHEWAIEINGISKIIETEKLKYVFNVEKCKLPKTRFNNLDVYIESVYHTDEKELGKCIQVEAEDGMYLVGEQLIPTHNSTLISHWVPVWFLDCFPDKKVIISTYEADFAAKWSRGVRDEIINNPLVSVKVSATNSSASSWSTEEGGGVHSAGVGGAITGRGGHLIIVDDPIKNWDEANSPIYREKTENWFKTTVFTRGQKDTVFIVLQTRWHQDDLAGRLQKEGGWNVIRFPAIAQENDPLGREVGEALCPDRFDIQKLQEIKLSIGARFFSALYQQSPTPSEGDLLKREHWKYYDSLPVRFDEKIQSWDMAFKDTKNSDYVVGQVWGRVGANYYLIDQVRAKITFSKTKQEVRNLTALYPDATAKLVEDKANGTAIIDSLKDEIEGIIAITPTESKYARAAAIQPLIEAGNVWLPNKNRCKWIEDFVEECAFFPNGKHDDQVDAMSQGLYRLKLKNKQDSFSLSGMSDMNKTSTWSI